MSELKNILEEYFDADEAELLRAADGLMIRPISGCCWLEASRTCKSVNGVTMKSAGCVLKPKRPLDEETARAIVDLHSARPSIRYLVSMRFVELSTPEEIDNLTGLKMLN